MHSLLQNYSVLQETFEVVSEGSDDYARWASGLLALMQKFSTSDEAFSSFFEEARKKADANQVDKPRLPRSKRPPKRTDDGAAPYRSPDVEYYWQQYFEAIDTVWRPGRPLPPEKTSSLLVKLSRSSHLARDLTTQTYRARMQQT
ncbi:hypothetical protein BaRGS_00003324 [Batillaria attramentaria]|uniref:Uncharacterized protein n=1 Tax=Batillaria attramentaria TaxID=370345 RepID=A0ABD0M0Y4_9CAEN